MIELLKKCYNLVNLDNQCLNFALGALTKQKNPRLSKLTLMRNDYQHEILKLID